jgi:hypothetical protein
MAVARGSQTTREAGDRLCDKFPLTTEEDQGNGGIISSNSLLSVVVVLTVGASLDDILPAGRFSEQGGDIDKMAI